MYERINQRVSVVAIFGDTYKDVRPFRIKWNGREHTITKIGYVHKLKEGKALLHVFSATDGVNFFELIFNTDDLSWVIGRIADGEAN
ncbi:MAG: hypothetical protein JWN33_515 [Candidatus Saccharibacteria bacterium]|nr:hypothetical protein [Candidatus Saccharibacteria bacterium]